jgi:glycosyltransferase involved in cell wall biosynthesis
MAPLKVSIITVSYNSIKTIEDTIRSVKEQRYPYIEYIVVDGASTDGTKEVIEQHLGHISRYVSEKDGGIYDAMNKGIGYATGDIVGILNSDDIFFDESVIEKVVAAFAQDESLSCVYGNIQYFRNNVNNVMRVWKTQAYYEGYLESGKVPPHPAVFVRRKVYEKIGLYKTDYKIAADLEFMIRLLKTYRLRSTFLNEFLVKMRAGGISTTGLRSYLVSTKEIKRAWNSNGLKYPLKLYIIRPIIKILQLLKR